MKSNLVATDYKRWKIRWPPRNMGPISILRTHLEDCLFLKQSTTGHCHYHLDVCGLYVAVYSKETVEI